MFFPICILVALSFGTVWKERKY